MEGFKIEGFKKKLAARLMQIDVIVTKAKREGKKYIDYVELAATLHISPTYARELLKLYARVRGKSYVYGKLIL